MSPVRNVSRPLADVMDRAARRGAEVERRQLLRRASTRHDSAGHAAGFDTCPDPGCVALREVLTEQA